MRTVLKRLEGKFAMLPTFAAAMAFYFVVSLIPFLIVVSKAVAWMFSTNLTSELAGFLREVLPPESRLRPEAISAAVQGRGLSAVSTAVAVWTASNGFNEMARAVHFVFSDRPHPGGWMRRLKALGLLGIWTAAISATAIFLVLIPIARESLSRLGAEQALPVLAPAAVRYPAAIMLMFAAFTLTYAFIPEPIRRPRWRAAALGGLLATAAWTGTCLVFAFLMPRVWGVSMFQGVLSSALATLVWAYCGCWGVLVGACCAAAFDA
ncbi:MAG: YihY/virulence factor BrkB family protein [Elusimicrobiota bacterium]